MELYGLSDWVGSLKNVAKIPPGIDAKACINGNSLPLDVEGGVKVLSKKTSPDNTIQNERSNSESILIIPAI